MLTKSSPEFKNLLERIIEIPVIDSHEHLKGPERDFEAAYSEPIMVLSNMYLISDLWSAGASSEAIELLKSSFATTDEKWPVFNRLWKAVEHTAYARVTKLMLKNVYGINDLTRESLNLLVSKWEKYDRSHYLKTLQNAGIQAVITDVLFPPPEERPLRYYGNYVLKEFLEGKFVLPENWHPVFNLPYFHEVRRREFVDFLGSLVNKSITSLDEYSDAVFEILEKSIQRGVIAIKDQSAYRRVISYDMPTRYEAEKLFNKLLIDPRNQLSWPDAKPLDDYLFHEFMRFARELNLPVQIHCGHMAGIRNRVDKTNAANFASVLELHPEIKFDLFHGNWPYMGDLLFLAKNYPNVSFNLCWVSMIDPIYSQELIKRAVMTVPHIKIHGFGGDFFKTPELVVAHLCLARELLASAMSDLIESGWLGEDEAFRLAVDLLFNNPNQFYNLGFDHLVL